MSFKSKLKTIIVRFFLPFICAFFMFTSLFIAGMRVGSSMQMNQDQPFLEQCAAEYMKMKQIVTQQEGAACGLKDDEACQKVCNAVSTATDGALIDTNSFKSPDGSCACFFDVL